MPNLAISLHATTEEQRAAIVPPTKKYSLHDILEACRRFPLKQAQPHHLRVRAARGRQRFARGRAAAGEAAGGIKAQGQPDSAQRRAGHPVRPAVRRRASTPSREMLADRSITVSVRKSRGRDIRAACGQLIVEGQKRSAAQQLAAALP